MREKGDEAVADFYVEYCVVVCVVVVGVANGVVFAAVADIVYFDAVVVYSGFGVAACSSCIDCK